MRANRIATGLLSLLPLVLAACTIIPAPDFSAAVASASTAADHQRIADFYGQKASGHEEEASWHEKNANSYGGYPRGPVSFVSHCHSLQEGFTAAAKEARSLEKAHRQMAAGLSN